MKSFDLCAEHMICPLCGGIAYLEDGYYICSADGVCTWCKEQEDL